MQIIKTIKELRPVIHEYRLKNKSIGFVPTMGALHPGHLSLIKASREECECTVISIYVNPIQFNDKEDFDSYPRNFNADTQKVRDAGVDILFIPDDKEIYSKESSTFVEVSGHVTNILCGISRPSHFRGVATVVCKLLNIVQPDKAYFGMKDAQQAIVVAKMVNDLNFPVDIRFMPIVREKNGLACSSRNENLTDKERKKAIVLNQTLCHAEKRIIEDEERDAMKVTGEMYEMVSKTKGAEIDYISIVSLPDLKDVKEIKDQVMIAMAVVIGETRLIDNITLNVNEKK
ncbi:MAG TPA: pantoate--beta-alanine ligase [Nitrospinota bacterium]|mgnify:CR=1 FL=1|jgi:pantoate--beta-alanine ligase|nr:pantoate--beta-alanine ligase [Nitrospinota bacterium]